ncbi:MAG: aminoglycoside phosphotransferase family protein [Arachnia sp.]
MKWPIEVPSAFRTRLANQNPVAGPWLEGLPGLVGSVLADWQLTPIGEPAYGGTSVVIPVRHRDHGEAALKLVSPLVNADLDARALRLLGGAGVVGLYEYSDVYQAMLLEWVTGPTGAGHLDPVRMAEICGAVAAEIATVPAPSDAPRLSDLAIDWRVEFAEQHRRASAGAYGLSERIFRRADEVIADMAHCVIGTMTHGDLSFQNIIQRNDGSWVAIDPSYLCGPAENEAHTIQRSAPRYQVDGHDVVSSSYQLLAAFCGAGGFDVDLAQGISHARFAASYYWEVEHRGDPRNVEWLRLMTGES